MTEESINTITICSNAVARKKEPTNKKQSRGEREQGLTPSLY
jgi:hypothetical protein